ncbi:hypothetical protein ACLOJK_003525, partial [Asimina triloba]
MAGEDNATNYEKTLNSYACNKQAPVTLLWLLVCTLKAGLEQEIEDLKKKLATCTRENQNLQEELTESQMADLHSAEVSKNVEAEKQLKFFQGCVAAAFAERDNALMEAEKAKEREENMSNKLNQLQNRVEELQSAYLEEDEQRISLQTEMNNLKEQNELFEKASLEEELETLRGSVDNLHNKLHMGLEIEEHLRKKVSALEGKHIHSDKMIRNELSALRLFHAQFRCEVINLLEDEKSQFKSLLDEVLEKMGQLCISSSHDLEALHRDGKYVDIECRDVHITSDADPGALSKRDDVVVPSTAAGVTDSSNALVQALQEKVSALLLLAQQEERHLLEKDVNAALQKRIEELKKNLSQVGLVTNEKVKALVELAQLKQENQLLQEDISQWMKQGNFLRNEGDKSITAHDRDGKLKNLLKKTYLGRWVGRLDPEGDESGAAASNTESSPMNKRPNYSVVLARLKVENATLQESISSMEHLTSSIHKHRLSLLKVILCST